MSNTAEAQVTIFSEDFETPSFPDQTNLNNANTTGWSNVNRLGNDNRWWILGGSSINAISGNYSLGISQNMPHTGRGDKPRYNGGSSAENIAQSPLIDATGYTSVTLDFDWKCRGENNFDFGRVAYSLDGTNWTIINQDYELQSTVQNVTNLNLSAVDGQQFYLGFYWENDGSLANRPSFTVDNIEIKGTSSLVAPANDECNNAIVLNPDTSCNSVTGTTVNATQSLAGCAGTADDDVWYSFVATSTSHTVTVESGNISDIVFEVFDGGCGVNSLVCEDNTAGASSETSTLTNLTIGATYHIRVYSYSSVSNRSGTFSICVIEIVTNPPPSNDECSNAIVLTPDTSCNFVTGTTVDATQSLAGCAGTADDDVWYSFVATTTEHTITVEADTIRNIVFEVFENSCAGADLICVDNTSGTDDETTTFLNLTIGTNYFIRVYSRGNDSSSSGSFSICITHPSLIPTPANDECQDSELLIPSFECNPTMGTTVGATETQIGCDGTADDDVWYSFRATRAQHTIIVEAGTIDDIVFEVFTRGCGGTSLLCENGSSGSSTETATVVALSVGTRYFVRVYSASGNTNASGTFSICILELCEPSTELGTTDLACPSLDIDVDGVPNSDIDVSCSSEGTELEADYVDIKDTSSYDVVLLDDFNPPFQFNCLLNPISVNVDDVWSSEIPLDFNFCFYGNSYSSLIIGSNGVISFRTELAGLSAGWVIENDIPSNNNSDAGYFGPSIFGVHHDIDPSKGGEIGYQLVTLDNGCRALVTAWDEVPMYLDNSILYSGMIVLYENTNIIDIYVKEKNLDDGSPWNDGNATIGLQGSATLATVPTNRNSLSPNWTATNEAYRFTPSGTSLATLNWYEDGNLIVDAVNDLQIIVNPSENTTYTAEVTYALCDGSSLVESNTIDVNVIGQKTWNGSQSSVWDNPNNWTPAGVPLPSNCVTIPGTGNDPIIASSIDGNGQTLTVNSGASLTQESNSSLTIEEFVNINTGGTYNLQDSASLIQVEDISNTIEGNFTMARTTNIRQNDYVYWSTPVTNFNIENVSPGTPNGYKYQWLPFANRTPGPPGPLDYGEWESYNSGAMDVGKGYIIKGPNGHTSSPSSFSATFIGSPNNGEIIQPIERSDYRGGGYVYNLGGDDLLVTEDDDNWNLIGNPYPSAINATDFLSLPANSNIEGAVYLWTHGTDLSTNNSDSFYQDYAYNYNVADYLVYNASGPSVQNGFDGNIGAGQGFFVLMNDLASSEESVTFNNSMRSSAYGNNQFYRNSDSNTNEKSRIWLDYISPNGGTNTTLIAYVVGATNDADRMFDAVKSEGAGLNLYSLINEKAYLIQGRQLPFDDNDNVPLGINITESGIQTLAINTLEGLFNDSNNQIFLEDLQSGVIHNLKNSPYTFSSEEGIIDERFVLRYNNEILGIDDFNALSGIKVFEESDRIIVKSSYESIKSIQIYDILGRAIFSNKAINSNYFKIDSLKPKERVVFLKIILANGKQKIEKLIF